VFDLDLWPPPSSVGLSVSFLLLLDRVFSTSGGKKNVVPFFS